jgi:hypothetical protein
LKIFVLEQVCKAVSSPFVVALELELFAAVSVAPEWAWLVVVEVLEVAGVSLGGKCEVAVASLQTLPTRPKSWSVVLVAGCPLGEQRETILETAELSPL